MGPPTLMTSWSSHFLTTILRERKTRNIFFYLVLCASFTLVEVIYGYLSNSLGLIGDGLHMLFDSSAIALSLIAFVISKWESTSVFSYGVEILAAFVNCIFLVFASFSIIAEALERLITPPDIHSDNLITVSVVGFLVNVVGIFAFDHSHHHHGHDHGHDHAHSHSHSHEHHHHGHDHSHHDHHDHSHHDHSHHDHHHDHRHSLVLDIGNASSSSSTTAVKHDHHKHQQTDNALMRGMFLHVFADALGSLGVITSSLLIKYFNLVNADSICSLFIASLILFSIYPLLKHCTMVLLQCTPTAIHRQLPTIYNKIRQIPGVIMLSDPHFWEQNSGVYVGTVKVVVEKRTDDEVIKSHVLNIFALHAPDIRWQVIEVVRDTATF